MELTATGLGPLLDRFAGVSRIALLRGGGLGDLMFALPAVSALKAAYPGSAVTLLGTPVHEALVSDTHTGIDDVMVLPVAEGVRPGQEDPAATAAFFSAARERQFDLAVQLHGGGRFSNPFLLRLQARHTVGSATPDAAPLERTLPYTYYQHEPLRAIEVAGLAGAPPVQLEARLNPRAQFVAQLPAVLGAALPPDGQPLLVLHPGASDPRRHWPAASFGAVARAAADDGARVLVVGDHSETGLAEAVVSAAVGHSAGDPTRSGDRPVASVAGMLGLGELAALLARADVVVANDSGPRHLAQALGAPTVGIYWAGNALTSGPLGRGRHRVHLSWVTQCPVCGADVTQVGWTAQRCPHDNSLVAGIRPEDVYADVRSLLH
ncbi:glycosyltransferase family 9 protein [Pseudarthrobacter sulfonivorans]|uniref:glycosyltransferase family 9 protein n=1 Tax=Pseudarthrobacter sulfonivorans TaxID=121292 RepID=UPI0028546015|nr:glycosyltransferase family 9 protein [Pseudarthrobacter sulfonivorans]MDR6414393.1 ADP-heptose:LPS heptosyltransferase [Pseudarthrobacter sulfonivorans]